MGVGEHATPKHLTNHVPLDYALTREAPGALLLSHRETEVGGVRVILE